MARRPQRRTQTLLIPTLSLAVIAGAVGLALPAPAYADLPEQIRQTQARIDTLNTRAEQAAERYDAGQISLVRARQVAVSATARVTRDDAAVVVLRAQAGAFAAQVYRGGSTAPSLQLLSAATSPSAMMDGLSALNHVAQSQADALAALSTARHRQAQSAASARAALADQQRVVQALQADKASVMRDARAAQQLLGELQVKQAALVRAAADAAARQAAQRRAAERAAQARATAAALAAFSQRRVDAPVAQVVRVQQYSGDAAQTAVRVAENQLGKPYVWGAEGPDSFDCSGLTKYAYAAAGIALPHYTGEQWNAGRHVAESDLQPGDLIFFHSDLHHMGMYIGGGQLIHAPHSGDVVRIASLSGWFQDNYAGAVRVAG
ncbi:MAG: C40 family peptidase [Mycobacteriales bacterium]